MPLTINVGLSRKVGEPNYGSRGASVNLEVELESALVEDSDRLKERIRHLFALAKSSVDAELNAAAASSPATSADNGEAPGTPSRREGFPQGATISQVRAIHAIARRQFLPLPRVLESRFGVQEPRELTRQQASQFLDELNSAPRESDVPA